VSVRERSNSGEETCKNKKNRRHVARKTNKNEKKTKEMMQASEEAHRKKKKEIKRLKRHCERDSNRIVESLLFFTCFCFRKLKEN